MPDYDIDDVPDEVRDDCIKRAEDASQTVADLAMALMMQIEKDYGVACSEVAFDILAESVICTFAGTMIGIGILNEERWDHLYERSHEAFHEALELPEEHSPDEGLDKLQ